MKQNLIVIILAALVIVSLGAAVYFFTINQKMETGIKQMQTQLAGLTMQVQTLTTQNAATQAKLAKALGYVEYLDVMLWSAWKQMNITPRFNFDNEVSYMLDLQSRSKALNDTQLSNLLQSFGTQQGDVVFTQTLNYIIQQITNSLK